MATAHPDLTDAKPGITRGAFGGGGCDLDPRMDLSGREQREEWPINHGGPDLLTLLQLQQRTTHTSHLPQNTLLWHLLRAASSVFTHTGTMEAAVVSSLARVEAVDCNSNALDAELEVKKLQALVRKLEWQNEQLRTRAQPAQTQCRRSREYLEPSHGEEEEEEEDEEAALDDLEPLDLDSMCASQGDSQETWLYITHSPDSGLSSITPLQWCRQTLDSPNSELESTRRSLSSRLEQVSRWRSSLSSTSLSTSLCTSLCTSLSSSPSHSGMFDSSPSVKTCSTPHSQRHAPLTSPRHPHLLRTLSPVPRDLSPVPRDLSPVPQDLSPMAERSPTFLPHLSKRSRSLQRAMFSPQSPVDPENPVCARFKLQDLTDVQVMARMQEDSLRQELSLPRPRRSLSLSSFSGALSGHEGEDESGDDCALLPPPVPPLSRLAHSHTLHSFHSLRDWPTAAAPPSPPPPSDGYGYSATGLETPQYTPLAYRGQASVSDRLRRSMPNLVRAPSMPCSALPRSPSASPRASPSTSPRASPRASPSASPSGSPRASPCLLRYSHSFDLSCGLSRLHSFTPLRSGVGFGAPRPAAKATAYVSPTIKSPSYRPSPPSTPPHSPGASGLPLLGKHTGLPAPPRSALPRPASFSSRGKPGQSPRSFLTPPKSLSTLSALGDAGWRDGCY